MPSVMAATTGPTPKILVVVVPDAATTASRRPFTSANWASRRRRSARSSLASSLRAVAMAPAGRVVLFGDLGQALRPHGGHGHRTGVVRVVLVHVAVVEQACPGGQLRLDVEHPLTGRDELLGEQVAEAGGVLYRPGALGPGLWACCRHAALSGVWLSSRSRRRRLAGGSWRRRPLAASQRCGRVGSLASQAASRW